MLLAQKFGMTYVGEDGKDHFPYIIHRTSIGCYERTLALLLEKICRCTADLADANTGNDYFNR